MKKKIKKKEKKEKKNKLKLFFFLIKSAKWGFTSKGMNSFKIPIIDTFFLLAYLIDTNVDIQGFHSKKKKDIIWFQLNEKCIFFIRVLNVMVTMVINNVFLLFLSQNDNKK